MAITPDFIIKAAGPGGGPSGSGAIPDYVIKASGPGGGPSGSTAVPDYIIKSGSIGIGSVSLVASVMAFAPRDGTNVILTSSEIDTSGATLLIAAVTDNPFGLGSPVSDTKGNVWTHMLRENFIGAPLSAGVDIAYSIDPIVGSHHQFIRTSIGDQQTLMMVFAFGGRRFAFDKTAGAVVTGGSSLHPGALTPDQSQALFVTAAATAASGIVLGIDSGFAIQASQDFNLFINYGGAFAWKQQSGALAPEDPIWSITPAGNVPGLIGCFKRI